MLTALASKAADDANAGGGRGGSPGGGRGRNMAQMTEQLGLSEEQAEVIGSEMQDIFSGMRAAMQEGGDPQALRAQVQQRMTAIMRKHLTTEQFVQYEQQARQRAETRSGTLWIQRDNGDIEPVNVRFGINDDSYTQVMGRNIAEGDEVVTRIRTPRPAAD